MHSLIYTKEPILKQNIEKKSYEKSCATLEWLFWSLQEKKGRDYRQFKIIDNGNQEPKSTKKELTETKGPDKMQKPLWTELNKNDFNALIRDADDNLDNNEFKTTIDGKTYNLKNAKKFLVKITPQEISDNEALKLYSDLIIPDITTLEESTSRATNRRENILNVLKNLESLFISVYLHYDNVPKQN